MWVQAGGLFLRVGAHFVRLLTCIVLPGAPLDWLTSRFELVGVLIRGFGLKLRLGIDSSGSLPLLIGEGWGEVSNSLSPNAFMDCRVVTPVPPRNDGTLVGTRSSTRLYMELAKP